MNLDCVINGDSLIELEKIPDESIDLVVTSPPYDNLRTYNGYTFDFEGIADQLIRVLKKGGVIVWIVADETVNGSESCSSFKQAIYFKEHGLNLHDTMIWDKGGFTATGSLSVRYGSVFEYMFVLSKGLPKAFNPIKDRENMHVGRGLHGTVRKPDGTFKEMSNQGKIMEKYGQRFNIWKCFPVNGNERTGHPAQFPEQLASDHIKSWSNEGDVVLDPFLGSGTTAVASMKLNRHFIGIEISKEYCGIATQRINYQKNNFLYGIQSTNEFI